MARTKMMESYPSAREHPSRCGRLRRALAAIVGSTVSLLALDASAWAQCAQWDQGFGPGGMNHQVNAFAVFDDGHGPMLYAGGAFTTAGGAEANHIARWNGARWSSVGDGTDLSVEALLVFDDGSGPALYVAGAFQSAGGSPANRISRWDGSDWSSLGNGFNATVLTLVAYDDGSGPALFAGGGFTFAGDGPADGIAKWDGSTWSPVGGGLSSEVQALTVFDPGSGPQLYAGGFFHSAGGVPADFIASWNGTVWSPVGGGANAVIRALAVYDAGAGPSLYAGGELNTAGGVPVNHLGRFDGATWHSVGGGTNNAVRTLEVTDVGGAPSLFAGGFFTVAGGQSVNRVARWNGSTWSALGTGVDQFVLALGSFDNGGGPELFVGGEFSFASGIQANRVARWDGSSWGAASGGSSQGMDHLVHALEDFDDGAGPALYAGGRFTHAGGVEANHIAQWSASGWSPLALGLGGGDQTSVFAMKAFGGELPASLYVGGDFTSAGGGAATYIARWDGQSWWPLDAGTNYLVQALEIFDDGFGPDLYVGGYFTLAGGLPANRVAKWDGSSWSALGTGMNSSVKALAVYDDGNGPALYAGGNFSNAGGVPAGRVAKWNGSSWSAVGTGLGDPSSGVTSLEVYDSGSGPELYAAGGFSPQNNIFRWDGTSWSLVGSGLGGPSSVVWNLHVFDDGSGPSLFATGAFTSSGSTPLNWIAKWDGSAWWSLGSGLSSPGNPMDHPFALGSIDDGSGGGPDLFVGGSFSLAGGVPAAFVARWRGCAGPGDSFCSGDGSGSLCPCGNHGLPGRGCDNSASTGGGLLSSTGSTQPDTVILHASGERPESLSIFLQGDGRLFPDHPFGDGLRCVGGSVKRLYVRDAISGSVSAPAPGEPSISARSASLGDSIVPGTNRFYQTWYRDPVDSFCPAPIGRTWNATNGMRIPW